MEMAREDEVESVGRESTGDAREVTEQDAEIGLGDRQTLGLGGPSRIGPGVDADELDPPPARVELDRLVPEHPHSFELCDRRRVDAL